MFDQAEPASAPTFDPSRVDDLSDEELDALPFGVIALDGEGTILRYNLYESRFARLDRNQVVGRNFFSEVAHCTRRPEFEGRFRAMVASGADRRLERFDFLFDFKFGAQEVSVELSRPSASERFYLFINRKRVGPARPEFPPEELAVLQSALAPDEARRGVLRDELERRYVVAPAPLFAALRATCERLAPETWQLFATEWGVQWGRRAAIDLEASALERGASSLRELKMRELTEVVARAFASRGWGALTFDFAASAEGVLVVEIDRSALAESAPRTRGSSGRDLSCHLLAGALAGILSSVAGRRLAGREVACAAAGASRCSMIVIGHERRGAADAAVRAGVRGVADVREALRRARREGGSR